MTGKYTLWARLAFSDYERLVLFYSVFVSLKDQDVSNPDAAPSLARNPSRREGRRREEDSRVDAQEDYVYLPHEEIYGGQMVFPPRSNKRHALRIYRDKISGGARIEARPLRGPKNHVPIWTAFIPLPFPANAAPPGKIVAGSLGNTSSIPIVRRITETQVEIRKMPVHAFLDNFELPSPPPRVRNTAHVLAGGGGKTAMSANGSSYVVEFADEEDAETFAKIMKRLIMGEKR
jgi:hypothetical protein